VCVHHPLRVKYFHGIAAGNTHECSLKSRIGEVRKDQQRAVTAALQAYVDGLLPPYKHARLFFTSRGFKGKVFRGAEGELAEANHREALPSFPPKGTNIWLTFPYAFSGISRITSRVNYLIRRGSPLHQRLRWQSRQPSP
jgi:hypothetical protein